MYDAPPLLDRARAIFLTQPVSMIVGSCNAANEPSVVRAYGCRVAADRRSVLVFLSVRQGAAVIRDVEAGGKVAVVFSRPSTHQTLQLKGNRANIVPLEQDDRARMRAYGEGFCAEIEALGYGKPFTQALMSGVDDDAVGIDFVPTSAFEQTPGPSAGQPLA